MKTKKFLKIALLVVIAALFIWTFVFLYQKSQPKVTVYETIVPEVTDLEKTTVATGKVEPRDEVLINGADHYSGYGRYFFCCICTANT